MAVDWNAVPHNDKVMLTSGLLAVVLSFFTWYTTLCADVSDEVKQVAAASGVSIPDTRSGSTAWESYATSGMLLITIGIAIVIIRVVTRTPWHRTCRGTC